MISSPKTKKKWAPQGAHFSDLFGNISRDEIVDDFFIVMIPLFIPEPFDLALTVIQCHIDRFKYILRLFARYDQTIIYLDLELRDLRQLLIGQDHFKIKNLLKQPAFAFQFLSNVLLEPFGGLIASRGDSKVHSYLLIFRGFIGTSGMSPGIYGFEMFN